MSECEFQSRLSAFHDGELDAAERERVAAHVAQCPACAAELAGLATLSRRLAAMELPRLSQMSLQRIHHRAQQAMDATLLRVARMLSGIAAIVLVGGTVWLMSLHDVQSGSPATPVVTPPPWAGISASADSQTSQLASTTPAAAWYLASSDDVK